ncbi:hypothetical protein Pfo_005366 [Paulownia fortunei]|nr:hypothetical protein Pfo_005366 [Paulownia fortunei]
MLKNSGKRIMKLKVPNPCRIEYNLTRLKPSNLLMHNQRKKWFHRLRYSDIAYLYPNVLCTKENKYLPNNHINTSQIYELSFVLGTLASCCFSSLAVAIVSLEGSAGDSASFFSSVSNSFAAYNSNVSITVVLLSTYQYQTYAYTILKKGKWRKTKLNRLFFLKRELIKT